MDDSLELKRRERETIELLVAKELIGLCTEASNAAIDSMVTGKYTIPDTRQWARQVISIIKEHSN